MKQIVIVNELDMLEELIGKVDGFLLPVEGLSRNFPCYFPLEELCRLIVLIAEQGGEVFVALNKNMHERDLEQLSQVMQKLATLPINGVFYYDLAVVSLWQNHKYEYPLIWNQEHMTTNYDTCNYWQQQNIRGVQLSSEITLEEILEIRKKTTMQLFVPIFGYLPMFVSARHLIKNYVATFQLDSTKGHYQLAKEGYHYPIIDDGNGTEVYSSYLLNGLAESLILADKGIDYVLLNSFHITKSQFRKVLECYQTVTNETAAQLEEELEKLLPLPLEKGFFYRETIYKVKKYEK